jgi:hypothetical protein
LLFFDYNGLFILDLPTPYSRLRVKNRAFRPGGVAALSLAGFEL